MDDEVAANRANWDERTGVHLASAFYDVEGWLRTNDGPRPREREALGDIAGRSLVHLQCHFGLDTLAFARAGATVSGLDFSAPAIEAARTLAVRAGLADRATFVCADVRQATDALDHRTFDVVYISLGALCWLPSIDEWAREAAMLVAPGGTLYLHDSHPFDLACATDELRIRHSYFESDGPIEDDVNETYTDGDHEFANTRVYVWNHGIGETVTALIRHGLHIDSLTEHDWTEYRRFTWLVAIGDGRWCLPPDVPSVPLSFTVVAHRPG